MQAEMEKARRRREERARAAAANGASSQEYPGGGSSSSSFGGGRWAPGGRTGGASFGAGARPPPSSAAKPRLETPNEPQVPRFASFESYDRAWAAFEKKIGGAVAPLGLGDIPWPLSLPSVSGAGPSEEPAARKKKLRNALLRWHPDKCERWMARVKEADRKKVTERVKEVTRLILKEKERFGG